MRYRFLNLYAYICATLHDYFVRMFKLEVCLMNRGILCHEFSKLCYDTGVLN